MEMERDRGAEGESKCSRGLSCLGYALWTLFAAAVCSRRWVQPSVCPQSSPHRCLEKLATNKRSDALLTPPLSRLEAAAPW